MRHRIGLAAPFLAIFILVALASPFAHAAPTNPCALLTQAQVSAALGVPVDPGFPNINLKKTCLWIRSGARLIEDTSVQVVLRTAAEHDKDIIPQTITCSAAQNECDPDHLAMGQNSVSQTSISGLGDGAYYTTIDSFPGAERGEAASTVTLSVKKGTIGFVVSVESVEITVDKRKAIEKIMAQQILAKL